MERVRVRVTKPENKYRDEKRPRETETLTGFFFIGSERGERERRVERITE